MKTFILLLFITLSLNGYSKDHHLMFAAPKHSQHIFHIKNSLNRTFKYRIRKHYNRVNQLYYQYEHSNPKE